MSEATVRTAIYTTVSGVADIGLVHDYERWAVDWSKFIEYFKSTISGKTQIRGWEIGRESAAEDVSDAKQHKYFINGYMGVDDSAASEKTFNALIEAVCDAFRGDKTLGGAALGHEYVQVDSIDTRVFGNVLCHAARLSLVVYEYNV